MFLKYNYILSIGLNKNLEEVNIVNESLSLALCLDFSIMLFIIGLVGVIWNRRNFIVMLICLELVYFSISLNFVFFGLNNGAAGLGQVYALLIIATVAGETSIGLSLLVINYRLGRPVTYKSLKQFRG